MTPESWHKAAAMVLERERGHVYFPVPTQEPWMHAYVTNDLLGDQCIECGQIGSYIHTPPEAR